MSSPNAYDDNENYHNEPEYENDDENTHENHDDHDFNDAESYQVGASSPFQYEAREETVDFQKLRQMRQTSQAYPQLDPLEEEGPASSPFRPNVAEDTVDYQRLRDVHAMSPGLDRRLALEEPMSSPFRPHAADETAQFHNMQEENSSPLARPEFHQLEEESPQSSPFRPSAREETVDFQQLREVEPLSPGIGKRLALEEPASSPFRPEAQEETVGFDRMHNMQNESPLFEAQQSPEPESSPFRPDAREETVNYQKLRQVEHLSPGIEKRLAVDEPASSPFRADAQETDGTIKRREMQDQSPVFEAQPSPEPESSPFRYSYRAPVAHSESPRPIDVGEISPGASMNPSVVDEQGSSPQHERSAANEGSLDQRDVPDPLVEAGPPSPSPSPAALPFPLRPSPRTKSNEKQLSSPAQASSPIPAAQQSPQERTLDLHKPRRISRISLGLGGQRPAAATPRKRSYDQTPQDQEETMQSHASHKKGMINRPEPPTIHVDAAGDSSMVQDQSLLSTSAAQDRSAIGNSMMEDKHNEGMSTVLHEDGDKENATQAHRSNDTSMVDDSMDDTCLSTFSAVPDMTTFAQLRSQSPKKFGRGSVRPSPDTRGHRQSLDLTTTRSGRSAYRASLQHEETSPTGSPTPKPRGPRDMMNPAESGNLLDLSQPMNFHPRQSMQNSLFSPRRPNLGPRQSMRSHGKMSSLLDFDIPPAPSPRSIPTVTPRELESLKSGFMSEISSLRATLSGKDAEVASLKQAVVDSERRVGEALEELRNEAALKEELEIEQAEWGRRGQEMETVLLSVQSQLTDGEREREGLLRRAEEADKGKEKLEQRVVELESRLSAARASVSSSNSRSASNTTAEDTAREVQDAVEKVARELHTLYKGKHETKVAALKKSYESRWEKRLRESEKKLTAALEENDELKIELNARSEARPASNASLYARENEEYEAERSIMESHIESLENEIASLKEDTERIRSDLEVERAEKGDLVAAVDEWLAMQQNQPAPQPAPKREREASVASSHGPVEEPRLSRDVTPDDFRRSIPRSGSGSGQIRPPATGEKRIPRYGVPGHSRGNSGSKSGIAMPTPGRGIMGSIERMGRGGA